MPRLRGNLFQLTDHAATVVNFNLFIPGLTVQHVFVITFDPQLANIMGCGVVSQLAVFIKAFDVFIVDFGDVTNDVRQRGAVRIVAAFIAFDFHTRETVLVNGKTGDLHFRQVGFYRNGGEAVRTCALFFERSDIVISQVDNASQRVQRILHVIHFLGHHLYLVDGAIKRQRRAVTIVDNAAAGRDGHQLDTVFV